MGSRTTLQVTPDALRRFVVNVALSASNAQLEEIADALLRDTLWSVSVDHGGRDDHMLPDRL